MTFHKCFILAVAIPDRDGRFAANARALFRMRLSAGAPLRKRPRAAGFSFVHAMTMSLMTRASVSLSQVPFGGRTFSADRGAVEDADGDGG
jgi:hypothetical protein